MFIPDVDEAAFAPGTITIALVFVLVEDIVTLPLLPPKERASAEFPSVNAAAVVMPVGVNLNRSVKAPAAVTSL